MSEIQRLALENLALVFVVWGLVCFGVGVFVRGRRARREQMVDLEGTRMIAVQGSTALDRVADCLVKNKEVLGRQQEAMVGLAEAVRVAYVEQRLRSNAPVVMSEN